MWHLIQGNLTTIVIVASSLGSSAVAILGYIKMSPWFRSQARLVRDLAEAQSLRRRAEDAANGYKLSSEGWQSAVERLGNEIRELKIANQDTITKLTQEVHDLNTKFTSSVLYIRELLFYVKFGGKEPPMPDDIRDAIEEAFRGEHDRLIPQQIFMPQKESGGPSSKSDASQT